MTDTTLIPLSDMTLQLPDPQVLRNRLTDTLESEFARARAAQGEVAVPEDTFALQRKLAAAHELLTGYARAFTAAGKRVSGMQEEQLIDAVGEQDHVPNQGLTIPDPAGDVRLSLDMTKFRSFDLDQLIGVVVAQVCAAALAVPFEEIEEEGLEGVVEAGIRTVLELGKFEPQVTKVVAYAKTVARSGADDLSSVVSGAVRTRTEYRGVKFERKQP